jgi:GxxExxY protein
MAGTLVHEELSRAIIGSAFTVLNTLKPGLDDTIYQRAMRIELEKSGHAVESRKEFPVYYDNQQIGVLVPDMIVDGRVIITATVVSAFIDSHTAQMLGHLAITDLKLGLLLNFKYAKLQWKRVVR